jgi:hypothetical protein
MSYTAKEIDKMSIEDLEYLGEMLSSDELFLWAGYGYSGEIYVSIMENRAKNK